jgi:hypothetical protein
MWQPIDDERRFLRIALRAAAAGAAAAALLHLARGAAPGLLGPLGWGLLAALAPLAVLLREGLSGLSLSREPDPLGRAWIVRAALALALLGGLLVGADLRRALAGLLPPLPRAAAAGAGLGLVLGLGCAPAFFRVLPVRGESRWRAARGRLSREAREPLDRALERHERIVPALAAAPSLSSEERAEGIATADDLLARAVEIALRTAEIEREAARLARPASPSEPAAIAEERARLRSEVEAAARRARERLAECLAALERFEWALVRAGMGDETEEEGRGADLADLLRRARALGAEVEALGAAL